MLAYESNIPRWQEADVAVVGGTLAGVAAAVAAARDGAATALLELSDALATDAYALPEALDGFAEPAGRRLGGRLLEQLLDRIGPRGRIVGGRLFVPRHVLAGACATLLAEAGVRVLPSAVVADVVLAGDAISGLLCGYGGRLGLLAAHAFVDATPEAVLACRAGAPHEDAMQSGTAGPLVVGIRATGVNADAFTTGGADAIDPAQKALPRTSPLCKVPLQVISPPDGPAAEAWVYLRPEAAVDLTDPAVRGQTISRARLLEAQAVELLRGSVPGFGQADFPDAAPSLAVADRRRIRSAVRLTAAHLESARPWPDAVGLVAARRDDETGQAAWHAPAAVPYRCIVAEQVEGLLAAGACISAESPAPAALRGGLASLVTGQAAGVAAALAARRNMSPRSLSAEQVARHLADQGAVLP